MRAYGDERAINGPLSVASAGRQLEDIGFTRATYVDQIKASVLAELDAADEQKAVVAPVNPNLVGAV